MFNETQFDNSPYVGDFEVAGSFEADGSGNEGSLTTISRYDTTLGWSGHAAMHWRPASFMVFNQYVLTTANNNAKTSCKVAMPFPVKCFAISVGCETAAGTTGTIDCQVDDATVLDAAEDVKTAAGTASMIAPEDGSEDIDYESTIKAIQTSGSAADMVGGQAHWWVQRR